MPPFGPFDAIAVEPPSVIDSLPAVGSVHVHILDVGLNDKAGKSLGELSYVRSQW